MKYLKTFLGLFFALYIPLMIVAMIVLKPRDPKVTSLQAASQIAVPMGILMMAISAGFAILTWFMDAEKRKGSNQSASPESKNVAAAYKKKKEKKKLP